MNRPTDTRESRLQSILERINAIHRRRRILGRPTSHLLARCKRLSAAWLACRHAA